MDAAEEEGHKISSGVSAHAGIFVFPTSQIPHNSNVSICVTAMKDEKTICKTIYNREKLTEEIIDLSLKS
jgi:hypothetical protein